MNIAQISSSMKWCALFLVLSKKKNQTKSKSNNEIVNFYHFIKLSLYYINLLLHFTSICNLSFYVLHVHMKHLIKMAFCIKCVQKVLKVTKGMDKSEFTIVLAVSDPLARSIQKLKWLYKLNIHLNV